MHIAPDLQLPSLPEITLRALEACQQQQHYRNISHIVSADTALVARILVLANSALFSRADKIRSVEQALLRLGTRRFQDLVLTDALRQLMFELGGDEWQQLRDFWRHSLTTALTARALATLTRYPEPGEAFMLGMLHNIGELIAIKTPDPDAKQYCFNHQSEIAAELATAWGLGPMAADAMLYQQALPTELRDAGHLVKLISLGSRLALSDSAGIAASGTIFGLSEELTLEINRRISNEVTGVAESLGISLSDTYDGASATRQLKQLVLRHALAAQALDFADHNSQTQELLADTVHSLTLITGLPALCFGHADDNLTLLSGTAGDLPHLSISAQPGGSILTEAFATGRPVNLGERTPTVLDRQLLTLLHSPSLLAVPVIAGNDRPGVFALGTDGQKLTTTTELASLFSQQLASRLCDRVQAAADKTPDQDLQLDQDMAQELIRKQVHEVSNPLTIVRQYIYRLQKRLDDEDVQAELTVIREELDRASHLLLRLSKPVPMPQDSGSVELNSELENLARILEDSLFSDEQRVLKLSLCQQSTWVEAATSTVRQIVINLIRNAVESLPAEGGKVVVRTLAPVWQNSRTWVELEIADTGAGISEGVRKTLFAPVRSTKGEGHSGLGLSIVKQLTDDMEGIIACRSGQEGTTFRVLLPAASNNNNDTD